MFFFNFIYIKIKIKNNGRLQIIRLFCNYSAFMVVVCFYNIMSSVKMFIVQCTIKFIVCQCITQCRKFYYAWFYVTICKGFIHIKIDFRLKNALSLCTYLLLYYLDQFIFIKV